MLKYKNFPSDVKMLWLKMTPINKFLNSLIKKKKISSYIIVFR